MQRARLLSARVTEQLSGGHTSHIPVVILGGNAGPREISWLAPEAASYVATPLVVALLIRVPPQGISPP